MLPSPLGVSGKYSEHTILSVLHGLQPDCEMCVSSFLKETLPCEIKEKLVK